MTTVDSQLEQLTTPMRWRVLRALRRTATTPPPPPMYRVVVGDGDVTPLDTHDRAEALRRFDDWRSEFPGVPVRVFTTAPGGIR